MWKRKACRVRGNDRTVVHHTIWMRPIATPIACFVVCVVGTLVSPATAAESIKMPLRGRQTRVDQRTVYGSAHFHDFYISSDEKLFNKILTCPNHILRTLATTYCTKNYSLRNRPDNRHLPDRNSRITDCNFAVRMLYGNMY